MKRFRLLTLLVSSFLYSEKYIMDLKALILVICAFNFYAESSEIVPFVVNGTDATIEEFPFLASLQYNRTHFCGSTIINEWWILTAAHCVFKLQIELFRVLVESTYLDNSNPNLVQVDYWLIHDGYDASDYYIHDVAVVKLKEPLNIKLFDWKVKFATKSAYYPTGTPAVLAGWGTNGTVGSRQNTLQKVNLQVYTARDCDALHAGIVRSTNICGGVEGGWQGQCIGDSGGPLLVNGVQVGIVSWSVKTCTTPPYPGVYTSVGHYIDWIEDKIGLKFSLNNFIVG
ncbi:chymotrypsin-1-like isoform X2 [Chironomus tepperi]|uniref:chymotrypsin-1-like isoform X2 n=1 Tax=Chironomus tepperi TaxID=113505 RepID=UPI00391EE61E